MDKLLKFYVKVFHLMGKALSGELSCMRTYLVVSVLLGLQTLPKEVFSSRKVYAPRVHIPDCLQRFPCKIQQK